MTDSALGRVLARYGEVIEGSLHAALAFRDDPGRFYDMMRYQFGHVDTAFRNETKVLGKRFRPALCLLACEAVGGSTDCALHVAAAIELLHNFSLIHDDIEDGDLYRRHRPTVWNVWGQPQAINVGDGMFALAGATVLRDITDGRRALQVASQFQSTALALTEGQYLDLCFEERDHVALDEYLRMVSQKSAALIAYALWAGAVIGGADTETATNLEAFGLELGRAFQIHDDIMGIWADEADTGKKAAQDLVNRKKSLPVILAMKDRTRYVDSALHDFLERRSDDVDAACRVLDDLGIKHECEATARDYLDRGLRRLESASLKHRERTELASIAREIVGHR